MRLASPCATLSGQFPNMLGFVGDTSVRQREALLSNFVKLRYEYEQDELLGRHMLSNFHTLAGRNKPHPSGNLWRM